MLIDLVLVIEYYTRGLLSIHCYEDTYIEFKRMIRETQVALTSSSASSTLIDRGIESNRLREGSIQVMHVHNSSQRSVGRSAMLHSPHAE